MLIKDDDEQSKYFHFDLAPIQIFIIKFLISYLLKYFIAKGEIKDNRVKLDDESSVTLGFDEETDLNKLYYSKTLEIK